MEGLRGDDGHPRGFVKVLRDATDSAARAEREQFLTGLAERAWGITDPDEVIADVVRSVGEFLGVSRCLFADIDIEVDTCTIRPDYRADEGVASIEGVVPISTFGAFVVAEYAARRAVTVDDVRLDPIKAPPQTVAAYEAIGIRAHVTVPVVHSDRIVSCISVHNAAPRHWQPEEIELLHAVVERTWLTVEVLRQQHALRREAETTARMLESITDGFYALDRDWRFSYVNAQAERMLQRPREEMLGRNIWEAFPEAVGGTFYRVYAQAMADGLFVSVEDYYAPLGSWMDVRVYPSAAGLSVFFQNVNARKALEADRERLAERERNIARQLQEALQPPLPGIISGVALAKHYEAALEEAGVGGDFYDVFPVEKGCTALVVGDLSGKGLAAAAQVSTVRNMLRAFLYSKPTLAEAVTELNRVITQNNLLTGFATLFVGCYDGGARTLAFVNCGQEPGLIRRAASGEIIELPPTGPILGMAEAAIFEERVVTLLPGDALAVFTDGLTEAGPNRRELLGLNGVTTLLAEGSSDSGQTAEALAGRLIAGVDAYARGGVRDDVCLLVAVVNGG